MDFNKPERINDKALEILQKRFDKVEPKFVKQVVDWVNKFRTTSGNLVRSKENIARLSSFKTAVNRFLEKAGYNVMVSAFLENFDEIGANTQLAQQELNGIDITKSFLNPFKRYAVNNVVAAMQGQGLNVNLINPLKNELLIAVNQGSSLTDVVTSIAGQLTTSEARQGVLKRISLQASRDALLQYDGVVNEAVRKSYKLDALLYVGSIVKDSRAQCERWVQETKNGKLGLILFEDLQDEIDWADNNGTGMIPDTTPENFCQNRGGFNCRHIAYPVRSANYIKEENVKEVPKEPEVEQKVKVPEVKLGFDKKYDDIINSKDVTDEAKILIDKLEKPKYIVLDKQTSFYDNSIKTLAMYDYPDKKRFDDVFIHEYGHHIDFINKYSLSKQFKQAYKNDLGYLEKKYGTFEEMIPTLLVEWYDEKGKLKSEYYGASDILDSLSKGLVFSKYYGAGHGVKYYENVNSRHFENFANIFQAWSKTDKTAINNIEKYYPNLYKSFLDIIKTL